jgi:hypothetical protein
MGQRILIGYCNLIAYLVFSVQSSAFRKEPMGSTLILGDKREKNCMDVEVLGFYQRIYKFHIEAVTSIVIAY